MPAGKKPSKQYWNYLGAVGRYSLSGAAVLLPYGRGDRGAGWKAVGAIAATAISSKVIKFCVDARRPDGEDRCSFPSQHTAEVVASAALLSRTSDPFVRMVASATALAVAISRIGGNKHHPRDVLAGATLGYIAAALAGACAPIASEQAISKSGG